MNAEYIPAPSSQSQNDAMRPLRLDSQIRVSTLGDRDATDLRSPDQQRGVIKNWTDGTTRRLCASRSIWSGRARPPWAAQTSRPNSPHPAGCDRWVDRSLRLRLSRARIGKAERLKDAILEAGGRLVICDMPASTPIPRPVSCPSRSLRPSPVFSGDRAGTAPTSHARTPSPPVSGLACLTSDTGMQILGDGPSGGEPWLPPGVG